MGLFYLYRHSIPNGEPFYIGVGTKRVHFADLSTEYRRAYDTNHRNILWKRIFEKNNYEIDIEILYESDSRNEILQKEIEFIKLYGRKNLSTGTLANLTDGGDGLHGISEDTIMKMTLSNKGKNLGRVRSEEYKQKMRRVQQGKKMSSEAIAKIIKSKQNISKETRIKIGNAHRNKKLSPDHLQKIIIANKGRKKTQKEIDKLKVSKKNWWIQKKLKGDFKPHVHTEEQRKKISFKVKEWWAKKKSNG